MFSLQEKAEEVSTQVVAAEERLKALDRCPFEAAIMGEALASLQVGRFCPRFVHRATIVL